MALSFKSVQKAYEIFHELKVKNIPSWPEDMSKWTEAERENPETDTVYEWDKKSDDGWENIFFFVRDPSEEVFKLFDELKGQVPNSSMFHKYERNKDLFIIGWF